MIVMIVIVIFIIAMIVSPTQVFVTRRGGGESIQMSRETWRVQLLQDSVRYIYTLSIMFKRNRQGSSLVVLSKQARFLFFLSLEKEIHITETYPITMLILFFPLPFGASRVLLV